MPNQKTAKSLTEAIEQLEQASRSKVDGVKQDLEKEYHQLKKTVEDLTPYLADLKTKVENQVGKTKSEIEEKVKDNPWVVMAFVGIFAFIIGCLFGNSRRDQSK